MKRIENKLISLLQKLKPTTLHLIGVIPKLTIVLCQPRVQLWTTRALPCSMALLMFKVSSGKTTLVFSLWVWTKSNRYWWIHLILPPRLTMNHTITQDKTKKTSLRSSTNSRMKTNVLSSSLWPCSKTVDSEPRQTEFLASLHKKVWPTTRKRIISGHYSTTASLQDQWWVSVFHLVTLLTIHTLCSVGTTLLRSLELSQESRLSRTVQETTNKLSKAGLWTPRISCTPIPLWAIRDRPSLIQLSLTLEAHSLQSHPMNTTTWLQNGNKQTQKSTVTLTQPSAK